MSQITIAPIGSKSMANYIEQTQNRGTLKWTGPKSGQMTKKIKKGDLFAFLFYPSSVEGRVEIHRIVDVRDSTYAMDSWDKKDISDRDVLELSERLETFTWKEWTTIGGQQKRQGIYNSNLKTWKKGHLLMKVLSHIKSEPEQIDLMETEIQRLKNETEKNETEIQRLKNIIKKQKKMIDAIQESRSESESGSESD